MEALWDWWNDERKHVMGGLHGGGLGGGDCGARIGGGS
jgi:hypothetical protein